MEKKLILVTSPPACGKTYVAKALAKNLKHVVYLDKDTLIVLSKQIFKVAGQPYDRSSAFFQQNIRDYEYDCVLALAMEALDYDDIVLINAPFTQEVRDNAFIADLKAKLAAKGHQVQSTGFGSGYGRSRSAGNTAPAGAGTSTLAGAPSAAPQKKAAAASYAAGDIVEHRVFGRGKVLKATPIAGDCIVEIQFDRVGVKKTMANYAPLKKVEE